MVELLVTMMIGSIVLFALTMMLVSSMRASARVTARVDATQQARLGLNRIVSDLQSACVAPRIVPLQSGSSDTVISFIHARGSETVPKPVRSVISLSNGALTRSDYAVTGGPVWAPIFSETAYATQTLLKGVSPIPPSTSIFRYYSFSGGKISKTPLTPPLDGITAPTAIQVRVALSVAPSRGDTADAGAPIHLRDSVLLRLTVPSYSEETSPPCE
jgi:hypothetical protein